MSIPKEKIRQHLEEARKAFEPIQKKSASAAKRSGMTLKNVTNMLKWIYQKGNSLSFVIDCVFDAWNQFQRPMLARLARSQKHVVSVKNNIHRRYIKKQYHQITSTMKKPLGFVWFQSNFTIRIILKIVSQHLPCLITDRRAHS